jgi:hypothetical protein
MSRPIGVPLRVIVNDSPRSTAHDRARIITEFSLGDLVRGLLGHTTRVPRGQCHEVRVGEPGEYVVLATCLMPQVPPRTQSITGGLLRQRNILVGYSGRYAMRVPSMCGCKLFRAANNSVLPGQFLN